MFKSSVDKCLNWIERDMLSYDRASSGVYERLRTDLNLRVPRMRPDTATELMRTIHSYKTAYGENKYDDIYENLVKWLMKVQNTKGDDGNTAFAFYFVDGDRKMPSPNWLYPNDNGKIILNLATLYMETGDERLLKMADESGKFWVYMQGENGYYNPSMPTPCMTMWMMAGMLALYKATGNEAYKKSAYSALDYVKAHFIKDGRVLSSYEIDGSECWRTVASENIIAITTYALCYKFTHDEEFLVRISEIEQFCESLIDIGGAIINFTEQTREASLNTEDGLTDLVYTDGFALGGFVTLYDITGNAKWLNYAKALGSFLAEIQCNENNPKVDGAWRGSYSLINKRYAGRCNQNNPIDEGGEYSVYVGWCALPNIIGMMGVDRILGER
jgi:uncharacterized protein YyaL (SSP411 family)